jgi:hypothetical protein
MYCNRQVLNSKTLMNWKWNSLMKIVWNHENHGLMDEDCSLCGLNCFCSSCLLNPSVKNLALTKYPPQIKHHPRSSTTLGVHRDITSSMISTTLISVLHIPRGSEPETPEQKDLSHCPWAGQENPTNAPLQRCTRNTQMEHLAREAFSSQCKASGPSGYVYHIEVTSNQNLGQCSCRHCTVHSLHKCTPPQNQAPLLCMASSLP